MGDLRGNCRNLKLAGPIEKIVASFSTADASVTGVAFYRGTTKVEFGVISTLRPSSTWLFDDKNKLMGVHGELDGDTIVKLGFVTHITDDSLCQGSAWSQFEYQEPVEFVSILLGKPFTLKGTYGMVGDIIYIVQTVSGRYDKEIERGSNVVTWAEMRNPNEPGKNEAFYCNAEFEENDGATDVQVVTLVGTRSSPSVDVHALGQEAPEDWCSREGAQCQRVDSVGSWAAYSDIEQYGSQFLINRDGSVVFSQTCSAYRFMRAGGGIMEIKSGVEYRVSTGYKLYSESGLEAEDVGVEIGMIFGLASSAMTAGLTGLASLLVF